MEVKEGIGTTTTLTVVKLKSHQATTDMRGVIDQIMRGPPKGKKSQVSEHIGVEPNDKEIRVGVMASPTMSSNTSWSGKE